MKKINIIMTVLFLFVSSLLFAQSEENQYMMPMMRGQMQQGMMGQGMMGSGMMHGMYGTSMMGMGDHLIMQLCHFGCPGFLLELTDELSLSEKQINDLKTMMTDYQKYATKKRADIRVAKIELSELLDMTKPDFGKVKNKVDAIAAIEKELRLEFLDAVEKSRNLLSDDQLKKLQTYKFKEDFRMMGREMMRRGMMQEMDK